MVLKACQQNDIRSVEVNANVAQINGEIASTSAETEEYIKTKKVSILCVLFL